MQRFPKKASFAKLDSQETTAIVPKITYHGFCGKCATRAIGHAFLFAEQGNRVRIPDTERSQPIGFAGSESGQPTIRAGLGGRLPKVAVILKHCFPCGKSPRAVKTGHWKGCHGPERRLKQCVCVKERILYA